MRCGTDTAVETDAEGPPVRPADRFEPLLTAEEGFPALERLAWEAERSIWMAFRIFEPATRIRSTEIACETWLDLLRAKLRQGVEVRVALADFDPIAAAGLHETTWRAFRDFDTLAGDGPFEVLPIRHEARVGRGVRYGLWLPAMIALERQRRELNGMPRESRREHFLNRPGIWRYLRVSRSGKLVWRSYRLPRLYPGTHHQKVAVFDGERAVIGGLDINERRWDTKRHKREASETWHDVSVIVDGPVVTDIARHLALGWNQNRERMAALRRRQMRHAPPEAPRLPMPATPLAMPEPARETAARGLALVRTVSENRNGTFSLSPAPVRAEIEAAHLRLIRSARRLIYAESQFLRSGPIADALAEAAARSPGLGLIMVLPAAPEQIAFDRKSGLAERFGEHLHSECIETVREAFGERAAIVNPARPVSSDSEGRDETFGAEIVYVHAKVLVVDDSAAIVSSANLNGRSLRWDTEAGIVCNIPEKVANLRERLFRHWLPEDAGPEFFALDSAPAAWRRLAERNAGLAPEQRAGFLVPHDEQPSEEFGEPVPIIPEEAV